MDVVIRTLAIMEFRFRIRVHRRVPRLDKYSTSSAGEAAAFIDLLPIDERTSRDLHTDKDMEGSLCSPNKKTRREAKRDRLSELPDDILLNILERVDTLDALRTCILSKRLLRLPAMFSRFDINIRSLTRHHGRAWLSLGSSTSTDIALCDIARYNNALAAVTEKILCASRLEVPVIHELKVTCYLRPDECLPAITRAFACIMATHKVDNAEFVPLVEKPFPECTAEERECYAKVFNFCLADCPAAFAGLTRLCLRSMWFHKVDIPNILTTCRRLEYLLLSCCRVGVYSVVLQVEHAQLVELHIEHVHFVAVHLKRVPKLQRLTCAGWLYPANPLSFGYVPQLSKLKLVEAGVSSTKNLQFSQLLAHVPSISDLHLDFRSEKIWVVPESPKLLAPVFGKLKIVNLDNLPEGCDIAWTMFILEAALSLREICITVWDHWCTMVKDKDNRRRRGYCEKANVEWEPSASSGFKHKNLVKLTIYGFQPDENMVRYVRRIMEVAVNIGEISLHDRKTDYCCHDKIKDCPSTYPTTAEEMDMLRVEITKGLGTVASPAVIHFRSK
uniref:Uncharacterized protein n=1 Tax=Avena sativa TaxID=4498 RepID=A0ACD5Z4G8_AVESA